MYMTHGGTGVTNLKLADREGFASFIKPELTVRKCKVLLLQINAALYYYVTFYDY